MKLFEAEKYLKAQLEKIYDEQEAANIASLTIEFITQFSKTEQFSKKENELTKEQSDKIELVLGRLLNHEPIQYIMNKCWFYRMELYVDKNVLIPRPETEELVDWVVKDVTKSGKDVFVKEPMQADATTELKILDVGTGSGCIALALKKSLPKAEVWGCDISEEALNVARRNGSALDIRVDFQGLNFLDESQQKFLPSVDIIVSNPPYIPLKDKQQMNANVINHEPHTALFVPDNNASLFYVALARFAKNRLYERGSIYMEIHEGLANEVVGVFKQHHYKNIEVRKDMQGKNRMVKVQIG